MKALSTAIDLQLYWAQLSILERHIELHSESWQWLSGDQAEGYSEIEEIR